MGPPHFDRGEHRLGEWEAIFTVEEHERIKALIDGRKVGTNNRARTFLLRGQARCGKRGSSLYGLNARAAKPITAGSRPGSVRCAAFNATGPPV